MELATHYPILRLYVRLAQSSSQGVYPVTRRLQADRERQQSVSTSGVPAAVNKQGVAADKIRGKACQEKCRANQIGRLRKAPEFDPTAQSFRARLIFPECATRNF